MSYNFLNIDNYNIQLPASCVISNEQNALILKNTHLSNDFDDLKKRMIDIIKFDRKYGSIRTDICLEEFYCNPNKQDKYLRLFSEYSEFPEGTIIRGTIQVLGIWFSKKSYGPYCKLINYEVVKDKYNFIDSESDEEIESTIKKMV